MTATTTRAAGGAYTTSTKTYVTEYCFDSPTALCAQPTGNEIIQTRNYLVVLDESSSMSRPVGDSGPTKWSWIVTAFEKALDATDRHAVFGLLPFPNTASGASTVCEQEPSAAAVTVPQQPAATAVPAIVSALAATTPTGGTPTAVALGAALDYYKNGAGKALSGFKYVVLITDGGPDCNANISCSSETCTATLDRSPSLAVCWNGGVANCCDPSLAAAGNPDPRTLCLDDAATVTALVALRTFGIETIVVGISGSEAYASYLDRFAVAGGLPLSTGDHAYYAVSSETEVVNALSTITQAPVRDCTFPLSKPISDANSLNVAVDCSIVTQSSQSESLKISWTYDSFNQAIVFQGTSCDHLKQQGLSRLDVVTGCPTKKYQ